MDPPVVLSKGQILRVLDYVILHFPDNPKEYRWNISIKNQHGDTEFDAFGHSVRSAHGHCLNTGYEIGVDAIPKDKGLRRFRRTAGDRIKEIPKSGWAVIEMWHVTSREADGRYSLCVTPWEEDELDPSGKNIPVINIYAPSIREVHEQIFALGYEFVVGMSFDGNSHLTTWKTLNPDP